MARLPSGSGGRRKIQLKRIENERERAVSFTKRHGGLFKKANELATLCGIEIAIFFFSLSGKPLSFGSPSVPYIINKYLNSNQVNQQPDKSITRFARSSNNYTVQELNQELNGLNEQLVDEKKRGHILQERLKVSLGGETYEKYVGSLEIHGLMELKTKLEELNRQIERNNDVTSGTSTSNAKAEADLSKIGAPDYYLKL